MTKEFLQELISFAQQKGFIWGPEPEIYGGSAGFYTYAPLGKLLKNNVENIIRDVFTEKDFFEVECPTIMPKKVWDASGHLSGFSDPMIDCKKCKSSFKVEQLLEELFPDKKITNRKDFLAKNKVKCPSCQAVLGSDIKEHDLMMKTKVGIGTEAYIRPETATTTYLQFLRYYDFFRKKLPFGVFQIGNAYRNEISPRQHLLRTREFTQAEAQLFLFKDQKNRFEKYNKIKNKKVPLLNWKDHEKGKEAQNIALTDAMKKKWLKNEAYAYTIYIAYETFLKIGIPAKQLRLVQHGPEEKAFYAADAWDIEANLKSFGWTELCGVHDRTDYDLKQHSKFSGINMSVLDLNNKKQVPHVLEIAFGIGRPAFALLDNYYQKKKEGEGKSILKLPVNVAPFKAIVLPLLKKPELTKLAKKVYEDLRDDILCKYDETASIGKRYLRAAEEGTPYAITIDYDSLKDKAVTIRDRDTEKQKRVKIAKLKEVLNALISGEIRFKDIKSFK
ncbi:glycine--tRNA ligase [Candidatus Woesearchaeota archaeon]|nr:glycine--tRNA ligase [Candidatus Woesearchaeota archaeon]